MVRIGMIGALSDTHFCILSRDCFNLSREYFSLWAIKTSLDRNASALLDREVIFTRRSSFLTCLAFWKLQVGVFQKSVLFNKTSFKFLLFAQLKCGILGF